MSAPLDTDSLMSAELVDLRRQVFELQQALANAEHSRASACISADAAAQVREFLCAQPGKAAADSLWQAETREELASSIELKRRHKEGAPFDPFLWPGEQVRGSEALRRTLYEHADVGIAQLSLDGQFLCVNPRLCETLGYPLEKILHRRSRDFMHPDDVSADLTYLR